MEQGDGRGSHRAIGGDPQKQGLAGDAKRLAS